MESENTVGEDTSHSESPSPLQQEFTGGCRGCRIPALCLPPIAVTVKIALTAMQVESTAVAAARFGRMDSSGSKKYANRLTLATGTNHKNRPRVGSYWCLTGPAGRTAD